ncbi:UDP-3-0-acyl N-acetylglucosamine deacetylase [Parvularcula bermudensis HTCC2503]|uniref:UDP-3-O-acyl-N-acetylglucosamine deacetylase n=1 Tax=Parvularcula bermudensis (strain ATCC BAA-594 / HTCC2503 / KCTC 12087) TaxID=314260 RepID=E0TG18_PARBH|nr:UDP-3-O-acyl-N-acetylglucosamine deacetylase [Parvularcula bermudensis]ADM10137.1 UDP-3-0-acyl N-acetylglucosamine deacetylase [Parvularcula bermudensis HTCC2503]
MAKNGDFIGMARTLKGRLVLTGIGLHSGQSVTMTLWPAPLATGLLFRRRDLMEGVSAESQAATLDRVTIKAHPASVSATTLGTVISNRFGVSVSTVEHILAALSGAGIDHALIDVDGPEVPIMDGSAAPFSQAIAQTGTRSLGAARDYWRLNRPLMVKKGGSLIAAMPLDPEETPRLALDVTVDYADAAIGRQSLSLDPAHGLFNDELANARTFCHFKDVEAMRAQGLALGGSLDNAIVVDNGSILNEGGVRRDREFVRHKALDLIGDLHLLGAPLAARLVAMKPGHDINTQFAKQVLDEGAVTLAQAHDTAAVSARAVGA